MFQAAAVIVNVVVRVDVDVVVLLLVEVVEDVVVVDGVGTEMHNMI